MMIEVEWSQNQKRQLYFTKLAIFCNEKQFKSINRKAIMDALEIEKEYDDSFGGREKVINRVKGLK